MPDSTGDSAKARPVEWLGQQVRAVVRLFRDTSERTSLFGIFLLFLPMAFVGTMLHEGGHIAVAQALGHETRLFYGAMTWEPRRDSEWNQRLDLRDEVSRDGGPSAETQRVNQLRAQLRRDSFWVSLGGPAQTVFTGTLGVLWLLWLRKRRPDAHRLRWVATLTALFWSREVFNGLGNVATWFLSGACDGDEIQLAEYLELPRASFAAPLGIVGFAICCWIVQLQPANRRLHLLVAGPAGCVVGFVAWYLGLGPLLMPLPE